jgi:hypothetical protein
MLHRVAACTPFVERRMVMVSAPLHLLDERCVAQIKRGELSLPPLRLGMKTVASFPQHENIPETVKLSMFAE